jgi:hypothetical protein
MKRQNVTKPFPIGGGKTAQYGVIFTKFCSIYPPEFCSGTLPDRARHVSP